jgi:hypothetical protein
MLQALEKHDMFYVFYSSNLHVPMKIKYKFGVINKPSISC